MPTDEQLKGTVEELAIAARCLGGSRLTLEGLEGNEAFDTLCKMGATVKRETVEVEGEQYVTESASMRVHWVELVVYRPTRRADAPPSPEQRYSARVKPIAA